MALAYARRWAEFDPFDDDAHAVVVQLLRSLGHHNRRSAILHKLASLSHDQYDLAWRQVELAAVRLDVPTVQELESGLRLLDPTVESQAMLAVVNCYLCVFAGEPDLARANLNTILEQTTSVTVELEANLVLARLCDIQHDSVTAEEALLQVFDHADRLGLAYYRASALSSLGWMRTRAGDHVQAERYLQEALDMSQSARMLIEMGRSDGAVVAASAAVVYGETHDVPLHVQLTCAGNLGAALTATGNPAAGIGYLRQATSGNQAGLIFPAVFQYWLHQAITQLGLESEARAAATRADQHIQTIRSDLTDTQWNTALANVPEMNKLVSLRDVASRQPPKTEQIEPCA